MKCSELLEIRYPILNILTDLPIEVVNVTCVRGAIFFYRATLLVREVLAYLRCLKINMMTLSNDVKIYPQAQGSQRSFTWCRCKPITFSPQLSIYVKP
jgi:hypothetical protein